jgi:single-strand DNA-binding protein
VAQTDLNTFAFCGRLTKDAEPAGDGSIAKIRLAVSGWSKDGEGSANYFDIVRFKAANLLPYLVKGQQITCSGRVEWREWEGENGKRQAVSFIANDLSLIGSKPESQAAAPADDTPDWAKD